MMASNKGIAKKMAICLKRAFLIIFSSAPNFLIILNLSLLSLLSDNSFKAKMAALDIKKIIPKYKAIKVNKAPRPMLAS